MRLPTARLRSVATASLLAAMAFTAPAVRADDLRGVIELFTSQGCSSCPPADKLLASFAREGGVLALSFPVDYWDYLGWRDTLATPAFTTRQKGYSLTRGDGQVYTPQVVVDGVAHAVGSDEEQIKTTIDATRPHGALSVPISLRVGGEMLRIDVGRAKDAGHLSGALWLVRVAKARTVAVGRGENAGKRLTYTNVVRSMRRIGDWNGTAASFEVPLAWTLAGDGDGYVILLQAGTAARPGEILAAAKGAGL